MISLAFPEPDFRVRQVAKGEEIFDALRRKWLLLTPEEWVRQNLVAYLTQVQKIPPALIALERMLKVGELNKRFDLVVYKPDMQPWLLAECKAMHTPLSEKTISQAISYCSVAQVKYMLITNGHYTYLWQLANPAPAMLSVFPDFSA
jgi:hypothetical protein